MVFPSNIASKLAKKKEQEKQLENKLAKVRDEIAELEAK